MAIHRTRSESTNGERSWELGSKAERRDLQWRGYTSERRPQPLRRFHQKLQDSKLRCKHDGSHDTGNECEPLRRLASLTRELMSSGVAAMLTTLATLRKFDVFGAEAQHTHEANPDALHEVERQRERCASTAACVTWCTIVGVHYVHP